MRSLLAGLLILGLASASYAQVRGEVESIGFGDGWYRPECWTPMVVRLDSQLDDAAEYRIEVHQRDMDFDHVIYVKDGITLNAHATQRWQVCFRPDPTERGLPEPSLGELQQRLRVYLTTKDGKQILQLPITSGVRTLEMPNALGAHNVGQKLVLMIAEGGSRPQFSEYYNNALGLMEVPVVVRINARDLPQTALAYQAVDAVLWVNGDARVLAEQGSKQLLALQQWVRQGGMLVVCQPGTEGERQRIGPFADMLPIVWQEGTASKIKIEPKNNMMPLADLAQRKHKEIKSNAGNWDAKGPFSLARATTRPSAVVDEWIDWKDDEKDLSPYIARGPYGLGSVTWVAQDLGDPKLYGIATARWPYVWDKVFGWANDTHVQGDIINSDEKDYAERALMNGPMDLGTAMAKGVEFNSKGAGLITLAVFFFIGYWIIAGPGTYLFLAGKKRSQHSWTAFAAAAVAATVLTVFVVDLVLRGSPEIHHATDVRIATGTESQPAVAFSRVGLYIPRDGAQKVSLEGTTGDFITYVTPMSLHPAYVPDNEFPANLDYQVPVRDTGMPEPASIDVPFRSTLKKLDVKWSGDLTSPIRATGVKLDWDAPAVSALSGSLDNLSGIDLKNVYVAFHVHGRTSPFRNEGRDIILYIATFSSKSGENHIDLKSTLANAPQLPLGGGNTGPNTAYPEYGGLICWGEIDSQWRYHWFNNLRDRAADQVDDLGTKVPTSFPMLSFYDRILPPKKEGETSAMTILRRGARNLNMSQALAAGELVILAQSDKRPLPYGLDVNGTRTDGEGTVFYQIAVPTEHTGVQRPVGVSAQ
jgi:hypothetical protein